jgi:hypothetical protein
VDGYAKSSPRGCLATTSPHISDGFAQDDLPEAGSTDPASGHGPQVGRHWAADGMLMPACPSVSNRLGACKAAIVPSGAGAVE